MKFGAPSTVLLTTLILGTTLAMGLPADKHAADGFSGQTGGLAGPDESVPKCKVANQTPIDKNISIQFYANDIEREFKNPSRRESWIESNCGGAEHFAGAGTSASPFKTDTTFDRPPGNLTTALNKHQFQQLSVKSGYYPNNNYRSPDRLVRIGKNQVRIFSIENATKVHLGGGKVKTVVPEKGTVRGFYHFKTTSRQARPPYRAVFPDENPRYWKLVPSRLYDPNGFTYDFTDIEIEEVCIVVNDGECGGANDVTVEQISGSNQGKSGKPCLEQSCNRSGKYVFKYDLTGHEDVRQLTMRVELHQTWLEEEYICYEDLRDCYNDNGGLNKSAFLGPIGTQRAESMAISGSADVTVSRPQAELIVAEFPDGTAETRVRTNGGVRRLAFGGSGDQLYPDSVQYQWSYFSKSPGFWKEQKQQPVYLHAYPARAYEMDPPYVGPDVVQEALTPRADFSSRDLPANIIVDQTASEYTEVDELVIEDIDQYDRSNISAWGIPPGTNADVRVITRQVTETNLTIEKIGENNSHVRFQVSLTEADGDPINTAKRPGLIYIDGQKYETGVDGEVEFVTRYVGMVKARFAPADWYRLDRSTAAYTAAEDKTYTGVGRGPFVLLYYIVRRTAPLWGSVLLTLYFVDKTVDVTLWPPWRIL
jgi:hypothetical protein